MRFELFLYGSIDICVAGSTVRLIFVLVRCFGMRFISVRFDLYLCKFDVLVCADMRLL